MATYKAFVGCYNCGWEGIVEQEQGLPINGSQVADVGSYITCPNCKCQRVMSPARKPQKEIKE